MFSDFITDTRGFLTSLARHNDRDWFQANKATYEAALKAPAQALLAEMGPRITQMTGHPVGRKLFRIHRDVRFSKDKRPYHEHLHMMWPIQAGTRQDPVLFFGIGLDYVTVGTGIMAFDKAVLADWRKMADQDAAYLRAPIIAAESKGYQRRTAELIRVPRPYAQDHPAADLLRHKGLVITGELGATTDLPEGLLAGVADLWPVADRLLSVTEAALL